MTTLFTDTPVAAFLVKAADVIDHNGWTQGDLIDHDVATEIGVYLAPMCAAAAIRLAAGRTPDGVHSDTHPASNAFALWLVIHGHYPATFADALAQPSESQIAEWNDAPGRTAAEVVARLREAAREVATW